MRNRFFFVIDAALLIAVVVCAFATRFEGWGWWPAWGHTVVLFLALALPLKLGMYYRVGLYSRLWKYSSIADLELLVGAAGISGVLSLAIGVLALPLLIGRRMPISVALVDAFLTPAAITIPRLLLRMHDRRSRGRVREGRRALVAGAGAAGGLIVRELLDNPQLGLVPVGFIDDDTTKHKHRLANVPVLGPVSQLKDFVRRLGIDEVIVAMPSAPGRVIREVVQFASDAGARTRTVPGIYEILSGSKAVSSLRPVEIQDLLRREPIQTNLEEVGALVQSRAVLVTGAGGSIGSELCRQIARLKPSSLVAIGRGENSIFELIQELQGSFPGLNVIPVIADVRDPERLRSVFEKHRPYSVFHAAAHKHVPLMEANVSEAILNNVLGTSNVARMCETVGTEHLVLISTDKAVRPTSIMGATKRIAEAIVHAAAIRAGKPYVSVRFGNVLGSRGSVIPTFIRQISAGGPITVTHPEMRRYFMTIPEAVQLVLQAATLGSKGQVFVLDMGQPVKIVDLATDLIRLSGLEPGSDIEIRFTGARPGEKLYEELFFDPTTATPTVHPKILQSLDSPNGFYDASAINDLIHAAANGADEAALRRWIRELVPEYRPTEAGAMPAEEVGVNRRVKHAGVRLPTAPGLSPQAS